MKCPSESTESLTSRLNLFIYSSVYMTIDLGTSSVVASSSCLAELLLAIFWAVFTGFSRFLVVASDRGFCSLPKLESLHAQVQFHAYYPLFYGQLDRDFTFSDAILPEIYWC